MGFSTNGQSMESVFRKYFWVVQALGLAVATGLAASAFVTQVATQVALNVEEDEDDPKRADPAAKDDQDPDAEGTARARIRARSSASTLRTVKSAKAKVSENILAYNVFCPGCAANESADGAVGTPTESVTSTTGSHVRVGEVKSQLPLRLMATMEAERAELSLATVYDAQSGSTGIFGMGDSLRAGIEVVGIQTGILHLKNESRFEYLEMGGEIPAAPARVDRPTPPPEEKDAAAASRSIPGAEESIKCATEDSCVVDRKFVEQLMANPAALTNQARIVPHQKNGETDGFKFYGIRRGSLPKLLGLKNGDMLTEVNGEELKSVDQAMGLVMKLRHASNLSVTLERRGKPVQKEIQIQ